MIAKYAPRPKLAAVHVYPDKREVCDLKTAEGKREYHRRKLEMAARQDEICPICKEFMVSPTFDHEAGRGMASAWRNDSLLHEDGRWRNAALCYKCNGEKGSRRFHWVGNQYVPVNQGEEHANDRNSQTVSRSA